MGHYDFYVSKGWWQFLLIAIISYLVGCFNFARLISRLKKKDVSQLGSGNPGAMNMIRNFGPVIGFLTFFLDAFKAGIPAMIVYHIYNRGGYVGGEITGNVFAGTEFPVGCFAAFLSGAFVVLGHVYPITTRFKGGKGIASGVGLFWLMLGMANPWFWLIGLVLIISWPITISVTRVGSVCSLCYLAGFGVWQIGAMFSASYGAASIWGAFSMLCVFAVVGLSWLAHHKNIRDLLAGEEHKTVIFKKKSLKK
jgi:glycerol-3-phosphate acyltransferase PlsY